MSKHHDAIKNDPRWKAARAACLDRDDHACVECGSDERLEADHIIELAVAPELAFELENLRTLCRTCHEKRSAAGVGGKIKRVEWINPKYQPALAELAAVETT